MKLARYMMFLVLVTGCDKPVDNSFYGYAEGRFRLLAPETAGVIEELYVQNGGTVEAGQVIASLNSAIEQAKLAEVKAILSARQERYADASKGARAPEISAAKEQLAQAKAQEKAATDDLERVRPLVEQDVLPVSRLDSAEATYLSARARVAELQERVTVLSLPGRDNALKALKAEVDAAEAQVAAAEEGLLKRTLRAPVSGLVERVIRYEGETAGPSQPIVRFQAVGDNRAVIFLPEERLGSLKVGTKLEAQCDNCTDGLRVTVERISGEAEYTAPTIFSDKERSRLVFRVDAIMPPSGPPSGTPMQFRLLAE